MTGTNIMAGTKGKSGGDRPGSGRTSLKKKEKRVSVYISQSSETVLTEYTEQLGISKSDIVDALCLLYLSKSNKDILHCPKCGKPLVWDALLQAVEYDVECTCGYSAHIGD